MSDEQKQNKVKSTELEQSSAAFFRVHAYVELSPLRGQFILMASSV